MTAARRPTGARVNGRSLAALAAALAAVALVAFFAAFHDWTGGGGAAKRAAPLLPAFSAPIHDRAAGVSLRIPAGWNVSHRSGTIALRSPDRLVVVTIAAPVAVGKLGAVTPDAVATVTAHWPGARVVSTQDRRLAGRPARATVVSASRRRALVIAVRGRRRAYLVEVLAAAGAPARGLLEAQLGLATLHLSD